MNKKANTNKMNNANSGTNVFNTDKNICNENFNAPVDISGKPYKACPETVEEMVNTYGTYNIQPTANTGNEFPAIAQGETKQMQERPLKFFRDGDDPNPAATGRKNP